MPDTDSEVTATTERLGSPLNPIHVLFVEELQEDFERFKELLVKSDIAFRAMRVQRLNDLQLALSQNDWHAVITEDTLPGLAYADVMKLVNSREPDLPIIVVSETINDEASLHAVLAGADDYIMKRHWYRFPTTVMRTIIFAANKKAQALAEAEVLRSREEIRALSAHLEKIKEDERTAVAREIHDDIGGTLTKLKTDLSWLKTWLGKLYTEGLPDAAKGRLDDMASLLDHGVQSASRIARNLRPGILDYGIVAALEWQAREFESRNGLTTTFVSNEEEISLPIDLATALFRICEEALTNITKHAKAHQVRLELFAEKEGITLEIIDDGQGLSNQDLAKTQSYGVRGMRERVHVHGGWVDINSQPGKGVAVMVWIPRVNAS